MLQPPASFLTRIALFVSLSLFCLPGILAQPADSVAAEQGTSRGQSGELDTQISELLYRPGQVGLDAAAIRELNRVLRLMQLNPELVISIQGHTDDQGEIMENQRLSEYRAKLVWAYLFARGVPLYRMRYMGFGFRKPKVGAVDAEARAANRRVEIHYDNP